VPGRSSSPPMTTPLGNTASPSHAMQGRAVRLMTFVDPGEDAMVAATPQAPRAVMMTSAVFSGSKIS
jgi:hypothetical protein